MTNDATEKNLRSIYNTQIDRRDFVLTSLAAGAMTLSPTWVSAQASTPYRIGLLLPSTGAGANYMAEAIRGLPVLAADINKKGGLLGKHPIEIIYRDTQTKPDTGAREARQMIINEKVNAIFGTYSSAVALAVQEIIHEHKVLHFAATSNSSSITTENHTPYTYEWCPDSDMQSGAVVVAVAKLIKARHWTKFVSIGQDYEWGRQTHKGFIAGLSKAAPEAKEEKQLWFKLGETDFTSYIAAIMSAKPDFIYPAIAGKDNETFIQQAQAAGLLKITAYPGGLISVTELRQQRKSLPRGLIGLARCPFFAHMDQPLMQKYVKMHRDKFGADFYPDDWACMYYDALTGLDEAVTRAQSTDTSALLKVLHGGTFDTCRGKRKFRELTNQLDCPSYVGEVWDSPDYPFPIYNPKTMIVVEGHDVWRDDETVKKKLKHRS
jgi:branched-chain amino acid transport system substrate-binding protein